jgi:outer membrane protein assembly factor BamB
MPFREISLFGAGCYGPGWLAVLLCVSSGLLAEEKAGEPNRPWKVAFRIPVRRISASVNQIQVRKDSAGRLCLVGPGFAECRDLATGKRLWRHSVDGEKGWLGVRIDFAPGGVKVTEVIDLPAARAGLREGDVITKVAGNPVPDPSTLVQVVSSLKVDETSPLEYVRADKTVTTEVTIGARPRPRRWLGEDGQHVYVSFGHEVIALKRADGAKAWGVELEPPPGVEQAETVLPIPWTLGFSPVGVLPGGKLLVSVGGCRLMALETEHGQPVWSLDTTTNLVERPVLVAETLFYLCEGNETLRTLKAEEGTDGPSVRLSDRRAAESFRQLTLAGDRLFAERNGEIVCVDPRQVNVIWRAETAQGGASQIAWSEGIVWLKSGQKLLALDAGNGNRLWERDPDLPMSWLAGAGDRFILGYSSESIQALNGKDGGAGWVYRPEGDLLGVSLVKCRSGLLAFQSVNESGATTTQMVALDAATGAPGQQEQFPGWMFLAEERGEQVVVVTDQELAVVRTEDSRPSGEQERGP